MHLRLLELEEFRSYRRLDLSLNPLGLRLVGANASGKSTLLEAVVMLATTRSPRSATDREVVNWASGADLGVPPFARVRGEVVRTDGGAGIAIALQADPARPALARKQIKLNGRPARAMDAVGVLKAVLFSPEDVSLLGGPPAGRRRYLDLTISQLDGGYLRALSRCNRLLGQRNSLLKTLAREGVGPGSPQAASQLAYWDEELVAYGSYVVARRRAVVRRLTELAAERHRWLTGAAGLDLSYRPSFGLDALDAAGEGEDAAGMAAQAVVSREFKSRLHEARADELRRGVSLIGPHRDDIAITSAGVDLGVYGSRGQQRLAVVAVKLAEADLMLEVAGEPPLLLLDDVLSELDAEHRELVVGTLGAIGAQVIVTATDRGLLDRTELSALPQMRVEGGTIQALT